MNEITLKNIESMIYEIRGKQVMLDSDLAKLYECKNGTKSINLAVKRNNDKFPIDFCFQLTEEEFCNLKFQNETSSYNEHGGIRKLPYAFTESGVAMLATTIHTNVAAMISINIMRAFVAMRHFIVENKDIYKSINNINNRIIEHDEKIDYLFSKFDKKEQLFLEGEIFEAYLNILDILKNANDEVIAIDPYADINFLSLIRSIKCNVTLITRNSDRLNDIEIEKYNKEYHNLEVIRDNSFHDRYFILDKVEIYHSGASINNAGEKTFSISKLEDDLIKNTLLKKVDEIIKNY